MRIHSNTKSVGTQGLLINHQKHDLEVELLRELFLVQKKRINIQSATILLLPFFLFIVYPTMSTYTLMYTSYPRF